MRASFELLGFNGKKFGSTRTTNEASDLRLRRNNRRPGRHRCLSMDHAFRSMGLKPPPRAARFPSFSLPLPEAFSVLAPDTERAQDAGRALQERVPTAGSVRIRNSVSGCKDTIKALLEHDDVVLGIATGKSKRGVDRLVEREGSARPHHPNRRRSPFQAAPLHDPAGDGGNRRRAARGRRRHHLRSTWRTRPRSGLWGSRGDIATATNCRSRARTSSSTITPKMRAHLQRLFKTERQGMSTNGNGSGGADNGGNARSGGPRPSRTVSQSPCQALLRHGRWRRRLFPGAARWPPDQSAW